MNFNESKPIYMQIVDLILDKIADSAWREGERIPSVRELGCDLEVNPNTVMRSYEWLSERNIIFNKRGIGFFVSTDAKAIIIEQRKTLLIDDELMQLSKRIVQLGLTVDEVVEHLKRHMESLR